MLQTLHAVYKQTADHTRPHSSVACSRLKQEVGRAKDMSDGENNGIKRRWKQERKAKRHKDGSVGHDKGKKKNLPIDLTMCFFLSCYEMNIDSHVAIQLFPSLPPPLICYRVDRCDAREHFWMCELESLQSIFPPPLKYIPYKEGKVHRSESAQRR